MRRVVVTALLFTFLMTGTANAEQDRIAVMELAAKSGIQQAQLDVLSDMLATEIRDMGTYDVVTRSDIQSMLGLERAKELVGCDDAGCLAEIGGALGVKYLVTGNVAVFGNVFAVNLKIIDIQKARVKNSIFEKVPGGEAALLDAIPHAVRKLLAAKTKAPPPPPPPPPDTGKGDGGTDTADTKSSFTPPAPGEMLSARELKGRTLYLRFNLRHDRGKAVELNYQSGDFFPAGSPVKIKDIGKKAIILEGPGAVVVNLRYAGKFTGIKKAAQWLQTVMSHTDPSGEWASLSALDQQCIREGVAKVGMSKQAALATMGWPPAHKTRSLDAKKWIYWRGRKGYVVLHFSGNTVNKVGDR